MWPSVTALLAAPYTHLPPNDENSRWKVPNVRADSFEFLRITVGKICCDQILKSFHFPSWYYSGIGLTPLPKGGTDWKSGIDGGCGHRAPIQGYRLPDK